MKNEFEVAQLREYWPDCAEKVISACETAAPFDGDYIIFLMNGGHFDPDEPDASILRAIKKVWPDVWSAIPRDMGEYGSFVLQDVLVLLGVL